MATGNSPRTMAILSGAVISAAAFMLLLWALAWFMPRFLHFADTRYAKLLPAMAFLLIIAGGVLRSLRSGQHP